MLSGRFFEPHEGKAESMSRLNWKAIAAGSVVAFIANTALGFLEVTAIGRSAVEAFIASFFVTVLRFAASFLGGYVAGRISGRWGGLNGFATVVAGFALTFVLWVVLLFLLFASVVIFTLVDMLALRFGADPSDIAGNATTIGVKVLGSGSFLLMFLGGYLGGKLGEQHTSYPRRFP